MLSGVVLSCMVLELDSVTATSAVGSACTRMGVQPGATQV
jgi:hypothetical protein